MESNTLVSYPCHYAIRRRKSDDVAVGFQDGSQVAICAACAIVVCCECSVLIRLTIFLHLFLYIMCICKLTFCIVKI
nr:MAG TPA: hypothetical protein [Caudoviricetes sp.]